MGPSHGSSVLASATTRFGRAQLLADDFRPSGRVVAVDGVAQSYVDPDDPLHLAFEYMRWVAAVVDAIGPESMPLRVLHLGGGAMTLARYVAATRPGSEQVVVEPDGELLRFVHRHLPLPRDSNVAIEIADARSYVERLPDEGFDLVVNDAFEVFRKPSDVAGTTMAAQVARVLAAGGVYVVNVADRVDFALTREQTATLQAVFTEVCIVAAATTATGSHGFLNAVLAATDDARGLPLAAITQAAVDHRAPVAPVHGASLARVMKGVTPFEG